jgi:hypothetical protein
MGRRYFAEKQVVNGVLNAQEVTDAFDVRWLDVPGFTFAWSGGVGLAGTFYIQGSFDGTTWFILDVGTVNLTGASGQHDVSILENRYHYVRGVFDVTGGSATFDGWYSGASKGI